MAAASGVLTVNSGSQGTAATVILTGSGICGGKINQMVIPQCGSKILEMAGIKTELCRLHRIPSLVSKRFIQRW